MASKDSKPRLTKLLRHNNLPSKSELQEAFELRSKSQEDLLQVDAEIQRLMENRAVIQKSIDTCNAILSPARCLLPDVLREIFYHCLPDDRNPILSTTEAPVLLTRICSIWRAVALTSPLIWARLHISLRGNTSRSFYSAYVAPLSSAAIAERYQVFSKAMELRCRTVKDWLTRSGTYPLSISLSYPINLIQTVNDSLNNPEAYDTTEPLFRQILAFSQRWKHVELSMPFYIYKKLETLISGDALPLLNSLRVNIPPNDIRLEDPDLIPVGFLEAPNLQKLSLNSPQLSTKTIMFPPIWGRLTDLRIQSTIIDVDFFDIIKLCHNLVTCQVDNMQVSWDNPYAPQTEVIVPTLQMIKINELGGTSHVVRAINAPNLKSLDYRFPARFRDESHPPTLVCADELLALVERGASTLRKLTMDPQNLRPEDTLTCLSLANEVSHLVLRYTSLAPGAVEDNALGSDFFNLDLLTIPDNSCPSASQDILLPKLEVLEMNGIFQFTDEGILRLLTSRLDAARRGGISPLRRLKLQFARHRQRDIREEASELAKSAGFGLSLKLDYPPDGLPYNGRLSPSLDLAEEAWPPVIY